MAETADSVIVAIEARTGDFDTKITQSARTMDSAMTVVERSATRAEATVRQSATRIVESHTRMGASGMILQHVVRASADQFAAGAPLATIFAQHIASVGEAAALSGSSMGRFGAFMAGPWGLAVSGGVSLLTALIAGHHGAGEEAHKHETAEQTLIRALNGEADAIDKVTIAMRQRNEEVRSAIELDLERFRHQEAIARADQAVAQRELDRLRTELAAQQSRLAAATQGTHTGRGVDVASGQAAEAQAQIDALTPQIAQWEHDLTEAQTRMVNLGIEESRTLTTHVGRVGQYFDAIQHNFELFLRRAMLAAQGNPAEQARLERLRDETERRIALRRAQSLRSAAQVDDAERGVTHRGPGEDVVNRADLLATARQHLGPTQGASTASLRQFFQQAGISIDPRQMAWCAAFVASVLAANNLPVARGPDGSPALNARGYLTYGSATTHPEPGDIVVLRDQNRRRNSPEHGHTGFFEGFDAQGRVRVLGGNQGRGHGVTESTFARADVLAYRRAPTAAEAQTDEQRAATHAQELARQRLRDEDRFNEELAALNTELLNARRQQVQAESEAAAADIAAINAQRDQRNERIRNEAAERIARDSSQAVAANLEAGFLLARSNELAETQKAERLAQRDQRLGEQRLDLAVSELNSAESIERARGALARTAVERRDSELRLLDLAHQEELLAIEKLRLQRNLTPEQRAGLDRREATANTVYGLNRQNIIRQNQGPLQTYLDQIPHTAREMNEALQEVAVDGLQQLNDGLAQAASRFLHLGGIAGHVLDTILNDLIQIVLRQAELAASGKGGGWSGFLSSLGQMFGASGAGAGGAGSASEMGDFMGGLATGGTFRVGGNGGVDRNSLSINGIRRAMVSGDETIAVIPQGKALGSFGGRAMTAAPQVTVISAPQFDLRGMIGTPELFREVDRVSRAHAAEAAVAMGRGVMKAVPDRLSQYSTDGR